MGHLWLLPIFLVHISSFYNQINCECGQTIPLFGPKLSERLEENYLTVENFFDKKYEIKNGDVMECTVTKIKSLESNKADVHVFTQARTDKSDYAFYPASKDKKCFSFEVRAKVFPHLLLSTTAAVVDRLEIILDYNGQSVIRTKDGKHAFQVATPGIVNDKELRGFWIRWLDNQLIEVGRDTEDFPFLSYRLPEKLYINFIGILSYTAVGEWIIHREPQCQKYNVTEKTVAETKCKIHQDCSLLINSVLEKSQLHILNQIKNQHEIFKITKFRSKGIVLEYQRLIKKYFGEAEYNQNKINAAYSETHCVLKEITYNEISKEYFQFLEELQMELSLFKDQTATSNENLTPQHCSVCVGCVTIQN